MIHKNCHRYGEYVNEKAQTYQRFQYIKTNMKIIFPHVAVMSNFRLAIKSIFPPLITENVAHGREKKNLVYIC